MSINGVPIRILLVGEAKDACGLRDLLDTEDSGQFHIGHVPDLDLAAEQGQETSGAAAGMNQEASNAGGSGQPQPAFLAGLFPACFIDVLHGGIADSLLGLDVSRSQGRTHLRVEVRYGAQRDGSLQERVGNFFEAAFADVRRTNKEGLPALTFRTDE